MGRGDRDRKRVLGLWLKRGGDTNEFITRGLFHFSAIRIISTCYFICIFLVSFYITVTQ